MADKRQLVPQNRGISCHCWSGDGSCLALSPNDNTMQIYSTANWEKIADLDDHDLHVSGMDWCPLTNMLVTASHDRNAFVWNWDETESRWKPSLVILRIDRAALDVKWSPDGQKFAVASGAKCVPICHYEEDNDWWVSKMVKKHKSTVTSLSWHPCSQLIATGSTDFKCRVISAFVSAVDGEQVSGPFPDPIPFGDVYAEFTCQGWVQSVCWSPSGTSLAYCGQDSSLQVVTFGGGEPVQQTIRFNQLPLTSLEFLSDTCLVGAGHDMNPILFSGGGNGWAFNRFVDEKKEKKAEASTGGGVSAARARFQAMSKRGDEGSKTEDLFTQHESAITCIQLIGEIGGSSFSKFSTSACDGRLVVWDLPALGIDTAALGI
uniref:Arp2/3 complex 41 kDa subunit n=1 Tax=Phaeomonas parva TaxID=124430 RepID=A0A7S1TZ11_9STRA|mmetsp:Transcript_23527/g.73813  ORF Transcript_23527/g.73813 Transcript_23527/m.73813 type:complete len:376 (+) Transcript_23527:232-1359(+)